MLHLVLLELVGVTPGFTWHEKVESIIKCYKNWSIITTVAT